MQLMLTENEAARMRFEELQAQAEDADLSEVEATNCCYVAGIDQHNRPIVVVIGKFKKRSMPWKNITSSLL